MKFSLQNSFSHPLANILRSCGYKKLIDQKTGKTSFVKKLTRQNYPRFHVYIRENQKEIIVDLHLDQTKALYAKQIAHRADYESEQVKNELYRIYQVFKKATK